MGTYLDKFKIGYFDCATMKNTRPVPAADGTRRRQ